jgi:hypothetical protein
VFRKLTNLLLLFALAAGVAAGTPLPSHSGEPAMMDCCKQAMEHSDSPHVAAARLCCAMNCNGPGSTNGNPSQSFSPTGTEPSPVVAVALPPVVNYKAPRPRYATRVSNSSQPTYILNLALLI